MTNDDERRLETFGRVSEFGTLHASLFPPGTPGADLLTQVKAARTELTQHASTQLAGLNSVRTAASSRASARAALLDDVDNIVRAARVMARRTPGLETTFAPLQQVNDQELLRAARTYRDAAAPIKEQFVEHYLAEDFLADLDADIADFEAATKDHEAGRDQHVRAGVDISATIARALDAIDQLDDLMAIKLRGDESTMSAWRRARRVEYSRRSREKQPPAAAASAGAPATT